MTNNVQVLSTALLDQNMIEQAIEKGIDIEVSSFINVSAITDEQLQKEIASLPQQLTVVFTSANAVRSVYSMIGHQPGWKIYCIGNATKNAVLEYADAGISGTANDAAGLAEIIKRHRVSEVVFFCGDKRMDTLPLMLKKAGITIKEIVVYTTEETAKKVDKQYEGILFFSPSGVHSFFSANKIPSHTILFAIGNTTAGALKEYSNNQLVIAENPSKELLVQKVINYFS